MRMAVEREKALNHYISSKKSFVVRHDLLTSFSSLVYFWIIREQSKVSHFRRCTTISSLHSNWFLTWLSLFLSKFYSFSSEKKWWQELIFLEFVFPQDLFSFLKISFISSSVNCYRKGLLCTLELQCDVCCQPIIRCRLISQCKSG